MYRSRLATDPPRKTVNRRDVMQVSHNAMKEGAS